MATPAKEWRVQAARRHEHLLFCPVIRDKCKGDKCEWWDATALECGVVAKGDVIGGEGMEK